ncbi:MAG: hypothetical protein LQ346_003670 [Caloplaca aetnensis]|nr:MAG: hypothetical protein LQ346_003670 [Caloplaca aetnensis]
MPKERTVNPATAHLKSEKARALKKSKLAVSAQRNERLASRNPSRLERQISELKEAGLNNARDKRQLEELEKQLAAVKKAREKVGDKAPMFGGGGGRGDREGVRGGRGGILGKRGRDGERRWRDLSSSGSATDESVRRIPMPRDTPPPISMQHRHNRRQKPGTRGENGHAAENANLEPLGAGREGTNHGLPQKPEPVTVAKTTYEAKPVVRDLRKEAVRAFMPAVVARKVQAVKGGGIGGRLSEEEEETLEREGHTGVGTGQGRREGDGVWHGNSGIVVANAMPESREGNGEKEMAMEEERRRLEEEEERFSREVRMEEVSDEDL